MGFRKYCDNVYVRLCFQESFYCETKDWLAVKQQELLGDIRPHAHAGTTRRNY